MSKLLTAWKNEETGEIFSPKVRLVFRPNFFVAVPNPKVPGSKNKFNCVGLIPAAANVDAIKEEIYRAAAEKHGAKWKTLKLRMPLVKTQEEFPALVEYAETFPYALKPSANEDFPPFILGPDAKPFKGDKAAEVYSGRWCIIAGGAWGYDTGSSGVGWNLNRVQLLDHDDRIGNAGIRTATGFEAADVGAAPGGSKPASTDDIF